MARVIAVDCNFGQRQSISAIIEPGASRQPRIPAFILDRDSTLVRDNGHVHRAEDMELLPGVREALCAAHDSGWSILVASNQAGVAKGLFSIDDVLNFNHALMSEVATFNVVIDEIRFCPHHSEGVVPEFRRDCQFRKPRPGMVLDLIRLWNVDVERAVMIGDQATDVLAAEAAGLRGLLAAPGQLRDIINKVLHEDQCRT